MPYLVAFIFVPIPFHLPIAIFIAAVTVILAVHFFPQLFIIVIEAIQIAPVVLLVLVVHPVVLVVTAVIFLAVHFYRQLFTVVIDAIFIALVLLLVLEEFPVVLVIAAVTFFAIVILAAAAQILVAVAVNSPEIDTTLTENNSAR